MGTAKRKAPFAYRDTCPNTISSLAPKYEELASFYTSDPTFAKQVTIAKVDATANDVPDEVQGFPTIKLYPAGAKSAPVEYSGDRSIEDLAKFVKENGKYKVDVLGAKKDESSDSDMPDAEELGQAAKAATVKVEEEASETTGGIKSKISEAAEAVKTAFGDSDEGNTDHDEL